VGSSIQPRLLIYNHETSFRIINAWLNIDIDKLLAIREKELLGIGIGVELKLLHIL
jgi:hypothetical protein